MLKESVKTKQPLKALREVENIRGGIMNAKSGCDLPRDRKQVHNLKYASKTSPCISTNIPPTDVLAQVMQMCKESSGSDAYVRSIEAAPEPMCVVSTDQQLLDIERFCTGESACVLSVDTTFNLGPYYVTPTTYQNLLVKTDRGNHPVILGPVLIHHTKTFRPFHYLASTMIRLNPRLVHLRAFGTDGESELIKAFHTCFPQAVHLRCTNHLRQNIKEKLHDLKIPQNVWKAFLSDIFGVQIGTHFERGLIDSQSESSFSAQLTTLRERWNNLERSCKESTSPPEFHTWFLTYKARDFIKCALPEVRTKAGVDPLHHFTTNTSESLNHIIKLEVEWKENKLPNLIDHLKNIVDRQRSELEKSVIGRGQWHFTKEYNHLIVSETSWFSQMSNEAKKRHLNKVLCCNPASASTPDNSNQASLSISIEDSGITSISKATLENMWKKAGELVKSGESILSVPWNSDKKWSSCEKLFIHTTTHGNSQLKKSKHVRL